MRWRDSGQPSKAISSETTPKNVALVPSTRLAWPMLWAPMLWAIRMLVAMLMPNTAPISANITLLALAVAVRAASPRWPPTQMALTEPLSDCSTLPASMGRAKTSKVLAMGPLVKSRVCGLAAARDVSVDVFWRCALVVASGIG